jgi:hypothetical protein
MRAGVVPMCFRDASHDPLFLADLVTHYHGEGGDLAPVFLADRRRHGRPDDPAEEWLRHLDALALAPTTPPETARRARELAAPLRSRGVPSLTREEVAHLALRASRWHAVDEEVRAALTASHAAEDDATAYALFIRARRLVHLRALLR